MKVLWIINIMLPAIAEKLNMEASNREGWLSGVFNNWVQSEEFEIAVACPTDASIAANVGVVKVKGIDCYFFEENLSSPEKYDDRLEARIKNIINEYNPDILHIFGTEFPHALAAARAFNNPDKTLVGIQGVCYRIAEDYMALLPPKVVKGKTFRDLIRKDSLKRQQQKFSLRGVNEIELIKITNNIAGRTNFDYESAKNINPQSRYYLLHETMRDSFYEGSWDNKKVEKHSIFIGQGDYPIKGMHFLLKAVAQLINKYPDIKIYIAGNSIIDKPFYKIPQYGRYLKRLLTQGLLKDKVIVLGNLDEKKMKEQYLKSSVFVCASYVENSPNTIAEAMLLGVPVVTSDAGGIKSVISENEGFIYNRGDFNKLATLLDEVWTLEDEDSPLLLEKCDRARSRAFDDYNQGNNNNQLLNIYKQIG